MRLLHYGLSAAVYLTLWAVVLAGANALALGQAAVGSTALAIGVSLGGAVATGQYLIKTFGDGIFMGER